MSFQAKAFVDFDVLDAWREALVTNDRSKVRRAFAVAITRSGSAAEQMRRELAQEPGPVVYADNGHLRWKSQRQKRYVMAKLRSEGNLPYRRTHKLASSYTVTVDSPLDVLVSNSDPAYRYVMGDDQQPFHLDTGWQYAPGIIRKYAQPITEELATVYLRSILGYKA